MMNQERKQQMTKQAKKSRRERGFTLIELLMVVVIIGILASFAINTYKDYIDKAKRTIAVSSLDTIRKTLEIYYTDHNRYPGDIDNNGKDPTNFFAIVFQPLMLKQLNDDLANIQYTYNSAITSYSLQAEARDSTQTLYTLTPNSLSK